MDSLWFSFAMPFFRYDPFIVVILLKVNAFHLNSHTPIAIEGEPKNNIIHVQSDGVCVPARVCVNVSMTRSKAKKRTRFFHFLLTFKINGCMLVCR